MHRLGRRGAKLGLRHDRGCGGFMLLHRRYILRLKGSNFLEDVVEIQGRGRFLRLLRGGNLWIRDGRLPPYTQGRARPGMLRVSCGHKGVPPRAPVRRAGWIGRRKGEVGTFADVFKQLRLHDVLLTSTFQA
jgi:hypothetical protein